MKIRQNYKPKTPKTKAVQQKKKKYIYIYIYIKKKKTLLKFLKDTHLQIPQVEDKLQIYPLKHINKIRCVQY